MNVINAGEFKAKCLNLMDEVAETGETIVIIKDDIIAPIDVQWDARQ